MEKELKILVTGSSGYIGSELVKELEKKKINFVSIDKLGGFPKKSVHLDLRDAKSTAEIVKKSTPDIVVHCGTHSALEYKKNLVGAFNEDYNSIINLFSSVSKNTRFIFFSSSYVYSGLDESKVFEITPLKPSHNFGVAKSFFEQFILRNFENSIIFRLSSVFGPGNSINPNAILNMARECIEYDKITVWGNGKRLVQYIYIDDVVKSIVRSFEIESGIYNLGSDDYISVLDTADLIAKFFGSKTQFIDRQEGETLPFMNNDKIKKIANIHFTPVKEGLGKYLKIVRGLNE